MDVPERWKMETDIDSEKLIFAFAFNRGDYGDYVAARAEQISLESLLRGELYTVTKGDLSANSWSDVIRSPNTPSQVGLWIMRHKSRMQALAKGTLQGAGGTAVPASDEDGTQNKPRDYVVDARILDDGAKDGQGSTLVFHVRTVVPPKEDDEQPRPNRYWSVKAVLQNGTITTAYVTANEAHFRPGIQDPLDGPFLDGVVGSLRFLPPQPA